MSSRPQTAPTYRLSRSNSSNGRFPLPNLNKYVFTERLGSGTYATVYKAFSKYALTILLLQNFSGTLWTILDAHISSLLGSQGSPTGKRETVAIKCVLKKSLNQLSTENLLTEIELLKLLDHKHIVQLKDFEWDDNYIYIIMEYCDGGDLMSLLQQKRAFPEHVVKRFLQQIALALQYMREKNVSHLDLKPRNILLSSRSKPILKIADFGFAHYLVGDVDTPYLKGSPLYMAPEIIYSKRYDAKADLWSVGVILYECLFGRAPWASSSLAELAEKIKENKPIINLPAIHRSHLACTVGSCLLSILDMRKSIPMGFTISPECRDLVLRLLTRDPADRIGLDEFFTHPFLELDKIEVVTEAIQSDESGDIPKAVELYLTALDHFIAALQYEPDETKRERMRSKIKQYLDRAELLKSSLRDSINSSAIYSYCELKELSSSHAQIPTVLELQAKAIDMEKEEKYDKSLERHQRCIESLLKLAPDLPEGRLRDLIYQHIQNSLSHAEKLQHYIDTLKAEGSKTRRANKSLSSTVKETCFVQ